MISFLLLCQFEATACHLQPVIHVPNLRSMPNAARWRWSVHVAFFAVESGQLHTTFGAIIHHLCSCLELVNDKSDFHEDATRAS